MTVVLIYGRGRVKVYLSDGRQSPRLLPEHLAAWLEQNNVAAR